MLVQVFLTRSAEEVTRQGPKDGDLQLSGFHEAPLLTARALYCVMVWGTNEQDTRRITETQDEMVRGFWTPK